MLSCLKTASVVAVASAAISFASAETPPAAGLAATSPAKQAIDARRAAYLLIGSNFKPIGDVLQGRVAYDAVEIRKRAARVAFLATLPGESFPDVSNAGLPATRAKAAIWADRDEFERLLKNFQEHTRILTEVVATQDSATPAFKAAAGAVGQDCKSCHDKFREK